MNIKRYKNSHRVNRIITSRRKNGGVNMADKFVHKSVCDRIEYLWDEINNNKNLSQDQKDARQDEIYDYIREARKNGEKFPAYIEMCF